MKRGSGICILLAGMLLGTAIPVPALGVTVGGGTLRVSASSAGTPGDKWSAGTSISSDGRFVAYSSYATNLVAGDTNGVVDIFVRDVRSGTTTRVSVGTGGTQANGASAFQDISGDGRYVTFESSASNLVPGDTNGQTDIFVRDLQAGTTERVSVSSAGAQSDGMSTDPRISSNGRRVVFRSAGTNLVASDTNGQTDIFVRDLQAGTTERVSVSSTEVEANNYSAEPRISADGTVVVFGSWASNLAAGDTTMDQQIFARDIAAGITIRVCRALDDGEPDDASIAPSVSANGRYIGYYSLGSDIVAGDTNSWWDYFVFDWMEGTTTRIVAVSPVFHPSEGTSLSGVLDATGTQVVFNSHATNLVPGDTNGAADVFVHDIATAMTVRVSVSSAGTQANASCGAASLSADGTCVAFSSAATNLVSGDVNAADDVFVYDSEAGGSPAPSPVRALIYRFYNVTNGTHFYTNSAAERDHVIATWPNVYTFEGPVYYLNPANNTQPLTRLYNRVSGSHFYTASPSEAARALATWPDVFQLDGPTYAVNPGQVANSIPVYRFYNLKNGSHFYTASVTEKNNVIATWPDVYRLEGPAFWIGQ